MKRDVLGRIEGSSFEFNSFEENEVWRDKKVKADKILFPRHNENQSSPVKVYHISELGSHD